MTRDQRWVLFVSGLLLSAELSSQSAYVQRPDSCGKSYRMGNTQSGSHLLSLNGDPFQVYCLFVSSAAGYVFPGRAAVANVPRLDLAKLTSDHSRVLLLQKRDDGSTYQTVLQQLDAYSGHDLGFLHNEFGPYQRPITATDDYLYVGFLTRTTYLNRPGPKGYSSNHVEFTHNDCDRNANSYFTAFPNLANTVRCINPNAPFLPTLQRSSYTDVMADDDFLFSLEVHMGGCGFYHYSAGCPGIKGYAIGLPFGNLPETCEESYRMGNTQSGSHMLSLNGDPFQVYCLFVSSTTGYVFPGRAAVANVPRLDLAKLTSDHSRVLLLQKRDDGSTYQTVLQQLDAYSGHDLGFLHNEFGPYQRPITATNDYLYVGFLTRTTYLNRPGPKGYSSNHVEFTHNDCDRNANSYFTAFPNLANTARCINPNAPFLPTLQRSSYTDVMADDDFLFSLEAHMGGCGFYHYSAGCDWIKGYAIGLPFGNLPENCEESYRMGNTQSGSHILSLNGDPFQVYCLFVSSTAGYVFPGRAAVANVPRLDLAKLASDHSRVLLLQKRDDGSTYQTILQQLNAYSGHDLGFLHNEFGPYQRPITATNDYLYVGFLTRATYLNRPGVKGYSSNHAEFTHADCDRNANSYFTAFSNLANTARCTNPNAPFLPTLQRSSYTDVMADDDFLFSLEVHMGGCGFYHYSAGCDWIKGYAIGLPFELKSKPWTVD